MSSPWVGVWEMVSDSWEGLGIITETHFSFVNGAKNRWRFDGDGPTDSEASEAYRQLFAMAGTFTASGSAVTHHVLSCHNPNMVGREFSEEFTIQGDRMTSRSILPDGTPGPESTWRRIG